MINVHTSVLIGYYTSNIGVFIQSGRLMRFENLGFMVNKVSSDLFNSSICSVLWIFVMPGDFIIISNATVEIHF